MKVRTTEWDPAQSNRVVDRFFSRPAIDPAAERVAGSVLEAIRKDGERAILDGIRKFDWSDIRASNLRVSPEEIEAAKAHVDPAFRRAAKETRKRVTNFAKTAKRPNWSMPTEHGGRLGEHITPIERVGLYIPGGTAPLVSTVLMSAPIARAAGVEDIVACTPPDAEGRINPYLLYALDLAGVTEIYRAGGIPAIGLMAYGTRKIRPVLKIFGPGGAYVTAAKKLVYGQVALDLVAGPSEVGILADASANPAHIAADLLAQAEHGTGAEKALLVTTSKRIIKQVQTELERQLPTLSRSDLIRPIIDRGVLLVQVKDLTRGMELCNRFAPEHFELLIERPRTWVPKVRNAGAIFCGPWTPEVVGDFAAGPSHVLPTGGAAAMFSGLTVEDFRKRSSIIAYTRRDLQDALPITDAFGRVEGLDAHARSAQIRFES